MYSARVAAQPLTKPLRVQSHVVGASLLFADRALSQKLQVFYQKLFPPTACGDASPARQMAEIDPMSFERIAGWEGARAMWVPRVASVSANERKDRIEEWKRDRDVVCHLSTVYQDPKGETLFLTKDEGGQAEGFPFIHVEVPLDAPLFQNTYTAPFQEQPRHCGAVNWMDLLIADNRKARATAKALCDELDWTVARPLKIPGMEGEYLTLLNNTKQYENRHKLTGMVSKALLLPDYHPLDVPMPLMFFCCGTKDLLLRRVETAAAAGGRVVKEPFVADGDVAIVADPSGAPFALYHRTDKWDERKASTQPVADIFDDDPMDLGAKPPAPDGPPKEA